MSATTQDRPERAGAPPRLAGVLAPVLTPFGADLAPDAARLSRLCRSLLDGGCAGLALFGTTSEANSLSVEERESLLAAVVASGVPPARLMPGTGCCALTDTVRLTRAAVRAGCAGVLMLPPFYYKGVSDDGLFRSFAEVIERVGDDRLRVYLYHIPPVAQVGIPHAVVARLLAAYPGTVAGMKDSSGDMGNTREAIERFAAGGFDVFAGSERFLLATMRAGGAGCITATANVNAPAIARAWREWRSPGAEGRQEDLDRVRAAFHAVPLIAGLKHAVAHCSRDPAWRTVRPPLVALQDDSGAALVRALEAIGFEAAPIGG